MLLTVSVPFLNYVLIDLFYVGMCICVGHMWVRGQLCMVSSLLPPCQPWEWNSDHQELGVSVYLRSHLTGPLFQFLILSSLLFWFLLTSLCACQWTVSCSSLVIETVQIFLPKSWELSSLASISIPTFLLFFWPSYLFIYLPFSFMCMCGVHACM